MMNAVALCWGGFALAYVVGDLDGGASLIDRALLLNSNFAAAWSASGWMRALLGEPETAIEHMARAIRLNPLDPFIFRVYAGIAMAHIIASRYGQASEWADKALLMQPNFLPAVRMAAASHALGGRLEQAHKAMERLRQLDPGFRVSNFRDVAPFRRPEDFARCVEGMRLAGLPE